MYVARSTGQCKSALSEGSVIPEHDHPHEQITYVVQGAMEFRLGDETRVLRAGDGVCCLSGVPHGTVILDAWYPLREEYR